MIPEKEDIMSLKVMDEIVRQIIAVISGSKALAKLDPTTNLAIHTVAPDASIPGKTQLYVDYLAQKALSEALTPFLKECGYTVIVIGEENWSKYKDLKDVDAIILVDPIDGTDLFAKDLSNWCCALVIYNEKKDILGAFVGMPNQTVYFSTHKHNKVWKISDSDINKNQPATLVTCARHDDIQLSENTIAWYGQKLKTLFSLTDHKKLSAKLREIAETEARAKKDQHQNEKFRILNIAGNPMFIKMIDNHCSVGAVIELRGQLPHDVIPGAYLAQKAGAFLTDLNGKKIKWSKYLKNAMEMRMTYILSNSTKTHKELVEILRTDLDNPSENKTLADTSSPNTN